MKSAVEWMDDASYPYDDGGIPMEEQFDFVIRGYEHLTPEEKYRARRADAIYQAAFDEAGIKMEAYQRPPAWVEFVAGQIDEIELWQRIMREREHSADIMNMAA